MSPFSGLCIAHIAFQLGLDFSLSLQWFLTNKNNFKIYFHAHKKLLKLLCFVFFRNAYVLWLLLPVISQVSLLMMFPRIEHINFPWVLVRVLPTKIDTWICLQCFANFCQNHRGGLAEFLTPLYYFPYSVVPESGACFIWS